MAKSMSTPELDVNGVADQLIKLAEHDAQPFFHLLDTDELLQFVRGKCGPVSKQEIGHQVEAQEPTAKNQFINEVFDKMKRRSPPVHLKDFESQPHLLNVRNGLIDLRTGRIRSHDPDVLSLTQLDVEWNPLAKSKRFGKFLGSIFPDPADCERALDMFAACLWKRPIKKDLMLIGETDSGKSTFLELVRRFLGPENVSSVSLQELDTDRFSKADLLGKLANIHADIDDSELKRTSSFKTSNGGDQVRAQRKFGHAFNFVPYAKKLYSCNRIPATKDESNAFWNRWIVVHCTQRFVEPKELGSRRPENVRPKDPGVLDKLLDETGRSAVLNVLISRARRIIALGTIPNAPSVDETRDAWLKHSDFVNDFITEKIKGAQDGRLGKAEVFEEYIRWCNAKHITPRSKTEFNSKLEKRGAVQVDGKPDGKHTVKQWKGIAWKQGIDKMVESVERKPSTTSTGIRRYSVRRELGDEALHRFAEWQGSSP